MFPDFLIHSSGGGGGGSSSSSSSSAFGREVPRAGEPAYRLHIQGVSVYVVCRIFLYSLTVCNTPSFLTRSVQLIFSIFLQHNISKRLRC